MKKINTLYLAGFAVLLIVVFAFTTAWAGPSLPENKGTEKAKTGGPPNDDPGDVQGAPQFVYELAESQLNKIIFIRYAPKFANNKPCNQDGVCDDDEGGWCGDCKKGGGGDVEEPSNACYGFLSGAKPHWNWLEDYHTNDVDLADAAALAVDTWEGVTSGDIFGQGLEGHYDWGVYDYINSLSFGDFPEPGVIGVTAIWYQGKKIYEYDIMFDTDYFPGSIDLDSVVVHEFGHAAGLDDLYDVVCADEVMYGYYSGIKTSLASGDIFGIQTLYGY